MIVQELDTSSKLKWNTQTEIKKQLKLLFLSSEQKNEPW